MNTVASQRAKTSTILKWMESFAFGAALLVAFSFVTRMDSPGEPTRALVFFIERPERFVDGMRDAPEATYYVGLPLPFYTERGRLFITKEKYHGFWRDTDNISRNWTFSPLALTLDTLFFLGLSCLYHCRKSLHLRPQTKHEEPETESSSASPELAV